MRLATHAETKTVALSGGVFMNEYVLAKARSASLNTLSVVLPSRFTGLWIRYAIPVRPHLLLCHRRFAGQGARSSLAQQGAVER